MQSKCLYSLFLSSLCSIFYFTSAWGYSQINDFDVKLVQSGGLQQIGVFRQTDTAVEFRIKGISRTHHFVEGIASPEIPTSPSGQLLMIEDENDAMRSFSM